MNEELREKMVLAFEDSLKVAGAQDYEEGMERTIRILSFFLNGASKIRSKDDLRKILDSFPAMPHRTEQVLLFAIRHLPQLMRFGFKMLSRRAQSNLPALTPGRPHALRSAETQELLHYISNLHLKGATLKAAKSRASKKYGIALRTVERLWSDRASIRDDEPTISEIVFLLSKSQDEPEPEWEQESQ